MLAILCDLNELPMIFSLPKTNIFAPENGWQRKTFSFPFGARPIFTDYASFGEGRLQAVPRCFVVEISTHFDSRGSRSQRWSL